MLNKKITVALSLCLLMAGLTGCKSKSNEGSEKTIKVGVLNIADSGALYVANDEGIFKKHGVKVELVPFSSAPEQSKAIEAGAIDAMMTDMIVQSMVNKGGKHLKEVAIALGDTPQNGKFVVVASPKTVHNNVKTLVGAKVGISKGTMMEFLLDSYCEVLGIDVNKIEKVNVPQIALRMEMLLQNKIDDAILPDPLGDLAVSKGGKIVIDDTKLNENLSQSVIVVDDSLIKSNKNEVQNFVDAYVEAAESINKNPQKYRDKILKVARVPKNLWNKYRIPHYNVSEVTDKTLFNRMQEWMKKKNLIKDKNSYEDMVDASFINNTNKSKLK